MYTSTIGQFDDLRIRLRLQAAERQLAVATRLSHVFTQHSGGSLRKWLMECIHQPLPIGDLDEIAACFHISGSEMRSELHKLVDQGLIIGDNWRFFPKPTTAEW